MKKSAIIGTSAAVLAVPGPLVERQPVADLLFPAGLVSEMMNATRDR